ncbi:related to glycinamide ribonucleotide transformylase [Cephalotrichum gorgonifer]|uniref:phosphoribosylglycinamide formyltransferase 1 n=1 Tax=Cephalotrichum gorgonifer TaxID=2041049 RepID=A0AAE8MV55_9PEZI|nr:related to glycinamide ribonucleotide transformylase [Cephalotrichum gorgonifer]
MTGQEDSPCRILVMASGFGSNFQALIDAVSTGQLQNSRIISLITNRKSAHAIARADEAGEFDGAMAIERAFDEFKAGRLTRTGIMAHYVIDEVDRGAPILVKEIEFREGEELEDLKQRMHVHEHELIVKATAKVVQEIVEGRST